MRLAAGMTFTDEPGIYVPGELGIRHEDTVVVTEIGCENLAQVVGDPESRRCVSHPPVLTLSPWRA
jgi:Xaa-Pro aminopeptidase